MANPTNQYVTPLGLQQPAFSDLSGTASSSQLPAILSAASIGGNTSGVLALISSGTLSLFGGNNITLSQNAQSISIIGNQSLGIAVTAGNTLGATSSISAGY